MEAQLGILDKKENKFLVPVAPRIPVMYYLPKVHKNVQHPPGYFWPEIQLFPAPKKGSSWIYYNSLPDIIISGIMVISTSNKGV